MTTYENKYNIGDTVSAIEAPGQILKVRSYLQRVYYCTALNDPSSSEVVYFERELQKVA